MKLFNNRKRVLLYLMIVIGGIFPIVFYEIFMASAPTITPREALELLEKPGSNAVIVDVRTPQEFKDNHLYGAKNWPYESIMALSSPKDVPGQFAGKHLLLLCNSGIKSSLAVRRLQKLGVTNVTNIHGGMQQWLASAKAPYSMEIYKIAKDSGETRNFVFREMPIYKQWIVIIYGFVIKPAYMLLSLVLIIILWGARSPDLKAIKWGLAFFLVGEAACSVNYYIFQNTSYLSEYLHSFGMVVSFGFITFALLEGMDRRIIKFSDMEQKCAALGLCRACFKYTEVPCGLKRLFLFFTLAGIVLAFIPLTGVPHWVSYNTHILGTLYNYSHPIIYQLFEFRLCPIIAILLFFIALFILLVKKEDPVTPAKVFFSGGIGYMSFGVLRFFLHASYRDDLLWSAFWEEATELVFVAAVGITLWIFRHKLLKKEKVG
ncbi:MAG: rhodanese-like domain-containing protein [Candidatus Aminicenantes bacterium]|nr:MAG: rhodanese-like domain-containing protein [Candidatus Aminicenantes bacterium]